MNISESPPIVEKEPEGIFKDEATDLLELYKMENPARDDIKHVLEHHYERFGRIGFSSIVDDNTVDYCQSYLTTNSPEYLDAELRFIQEVLASDLDRIVEQGFLRARSLVPEQEYQTPQAVFVLNGRRTDAKVLGGGHFGINLQNLFGRSYSEETNTYDIQRAMQIIRNISAHEATHVLEEQVEHSEGDKVNLLIVGAFNEGLATFAETDFNYVWSRDYLDDSEHTLEIIRATFRGEPYDKILADLCNFASLIKHKPEEVESARELLSKGPISDEDFRTTLRELLVDKNGPLYYAGYAVWKKIYEAGGIERVRDVVKRGPKAFSEYM